MVGVVVGVVVGGGEDTGGMVDDISPDPTTVGDGDWAHDTASKHTSTINLDIMVEEDLDKQDKVTRKWQT